MTDKKISQLNSATSLAGDELIPVVQGGETKKITIDQIVDFRSTVAEFTVAAFTWDSATASPAALVTRTLPALVRETLYDNMRGCVLNDDGTVNYYLKADDWSKKADGTASDLTGADGNVMIEIPKFYYRTTRIGTEITWEISSIEFSGFTLHPAFILDGSEVSHRYIGAYDACYLDATDSTYKSGLNLDDMTSSLDLSNDKLASVKGVYPLVGASRDECRDLAANNGVGWRQLDFYLWSAVQMLYLIEYQTFYSQDELGIGNTSNNYSGPSSTNQSDSPHTIAGAGDSWANGSTDGTQPSEGAKPGTAYMKYRGIENIYGNTWNWVDGINVNVGGTGNVHLADDNNRSNYADDTATGHTLVSSNLSTGSNYISALLPLDQYFLPSAVSGSSSTYMTDYHYASSSSNRVVRVGGSASNVSPAGFFCFDSNLSSSLDFRSFGARLAR